MKQPSVHKRVSWRLLTTAALGVGTAATVSCGGLGDDTPAAESSAQNEQASESSPGESTAKITAVTGPGGLTSEGLPAGTFLGKGAALSAGQKIATPKGTLAELSVGNGIRVRMNEDTELSVPSAKGEPATLTRGELVVLAGKAGDAAFEIRAADDSLIVESGEAQVRTGETRRFAVVHGHAKLVTPAKTLELSAGESIETPLPEEVPQPKPELSLRSLDDTGWARTFDAAAKMADDVPRGVGSLTARRAGSKVEKQQLRLTDHRVDVSISGRIAHTEIEQAFFNDQPAVLEGIYRFPMPGEASMSGLGLLVGNRWMDGEIVEKQRARQIFSSIVDATIPRDPALLEWEQGNMFKLRVFPIPGRGERRVRLSYTQVLPVVGGKLRYRYPMGGSGATATPIDNFAFSVKVDGSELQPDQLSNISTPMLALERNDTGTLVELHTEREAFLPTFDLGVDIPVPTSEKQVHASTHLDQDGQAYFMVSVKPELDLAADARPVHYAFVLDRSHSTSPELWTTARGVVDALTELMDREDRFTVLACDTACEEHADGLQAPQTDAVERAQRFLTDQDLVGASDLGGSLASARDALSRGGTEAQKVIVYLGDGVPTSGEMSADGLHNQMKAELQDTRVLAVALGARSDLTTLGAVVSATGGDLISADARDDLRSLVRELRLRAEVPSLRNVEFDLPDGMAVVRQKNVSALRPGDTVLLAGKLRGPVNGAITMRAQGPRGPVTESFDVSMSAARAERGGVDSHLPRTWAQMQIAHLTRTEGFAARDEIIALSKDFNVLSRHTALLVLENDAMYREFNVVRGAKNTDKWDGKLSASAAGEGGLAENKADAKTTAADADDRTKEEVTSVAEAKPKPKPTEDPVGDVAGGADTGSGFGRKGTGRGGGGTETPARNRAAGPPSTAPTVPSQLGRLDKPGRDEPLEPEPEPEPTPEFSDRGESLKDIDVIEEDEDDEAPRTTTSAPATKAPSAPRKAEKKKKSASRRPRRGDQNEPMGDNWGGPATGGMIGGVGTTGGWREQRRGRRWRPAPRLRVRTGVTPSTRARTQIRELAAAVQRDPTKRSVHSKLVRAALRAGHEDSLRFARAWADVDPDHAGALTALADALAVTGDPLAARAFESVSEVSPFSATRHRALASAFENKGDFTRSCSHRRAAVSIDPASAEHNGELVACLQRAGRIREANAIADGFVAAGATVKDRSRRVADLDRKVAASKISLHGSPQLRATLTWAGSDDLDIAFVDSKGRRLSSLHPEKLIRASESRGREEMTMRKVSRSVFVEVTRLARPGDAPLEDGAGPRTVSAQLQVRAGGRTKSIPVTLDVGTKRVAKVFWSR